MNIKALRFGFISFAFLSLTCVAWQAIYANSESHKRSSAIDLLQYHSLNQNNIRSQNLSNADSAFASKPVAAAVPHKLAIEIQGSSAWSSVKVRQMVARLFRAVAAMDVKVTDNNNAVNSKIAALKAKVHGTRAVNTHQSRLVHTPDSAKIQSELKSLRKQVVTEASELEVMNKTTRAEQMNMHGGLASLRNRIKTDYAALRDDISLAQKRLALHVKSNLSRVIEKIRHEKDSEIDGERIEERHALQIKKVLANLQVLAASMHSQVTAVDNDMMSRDFDYRRKFRSLQHKVKIDSGLIRSMREKEENFKSDADDLSRIRIGNVHKLSRELAKVRLMEKAEAARAAGLKKGLLAVEEDVTLLRNEEKGLRSRETSEQQKERDASQKLSSVNRHVEHLDERVGALKAWAGNQSRFDAGLDGLVSKVPQRLEAVDRDVRLQIKKAVSHKRVAQLAASERRKNTDDREAAAKAGDDDDDARRRPGSDSEGKRAESPDRRANAWKAQVKHQRHAARTQKRAGDDKPDPECLVKGSSGGCVVKKGGRADCVVPGLDGGCIVRRLFSRSSR